MDKFLGILFFYTITFYKGRNTNLLDNPYRLEYLQEKSRRYLNKDITHAEWELLKIYLKDLPTPNDDGNDPLTLDHVSTLIEAFDKVYGFDNINNIIDLGEPDKEREKELWNEIYNNLPGFISIVGSFNGLSIPLSRWLEKMEYDRKLIQRDVAFTELGI